MLSKPNSTGGSRTGHKYSTRRMLLEKVDVFVGGKASFSEKRVRGAADTFLCLLLQQLQEAI